MLSEPSSAAACSAGPSNGAGAISPSLQIQQFSRDERTPALSRTAGEKLGLLGSGLFPDDERLDEAQDVPGREKCQALEREAFELVEKLGDQESDGERAGLLSQEHFDAQCLDEREHIPLLG
jgi:hypothetical protein